MKLMGLFTGFDAEIQAYCLNILALTMTGRYAV